MRLSPPIPKLPLSYKILSILSKVMARPSAICQQDP